MFLFSLFFNEPATTEIYTYGHTLSLHDALPILNRNDRELGMGAAISRRDFVYGASAVAGAAAFTGSAAFAAQSATYAPAAAATYPPLRTGKIGRAHV